MKASHFLSNILYEGFLWVSHSPYIPWKDFHHFLGGFWFLLHSSISLVVSLIGDDFKISLNWGWLPNFMFCSTSFSLITFFEFLTLNFSLLSLSYFLISFSQFLFRAIFFVRAFPKSPYGFVIFLGELFSLWIDLFIGIPYVSHSLGILSLLG